MFEIAKQLQNNFFRMYIHEYFQALHLKKCLKGLNGFKEFFFQGVFMNILKSAPKKIFEIAEQLQRIFSRVHLKIVF